MLRIELRRKLMLVALLTTAAWAWGGRPAVAQQTSSPARYVPRENLILYVEFDGLANHQEGWKKTATHKILHDAGCGAMLREVIQQSIDGMRQGDTNSPTGKQVVSFLERLAESGFVLAVHGKPGFAGTSAMLVIRDAPEEWNSTLSTLARSVRSQSEVVTRPDGRKVTLVRTPPDTSWGWWQEKKDLVLLMSNPEASLEAVVDTLTGKTPSVVDHPIRQELMKPDASIETVAISFVDLAKLPPTPPALGLKGLKRIDSRWGFQGEALVSVAHVVAPKPRTGLLAFMDQPSFSTTGGLPVPAGVTEFGMFSVDLVKFHDQAVSLAQAMHPQLAGPIAMMTDKVQQTTGLKPREQILGQVGPRFAMFMTSEKLAVPSTPYHSLAQWFLHLPKFTMLAETKDEAEFGKSLDTLMSIANRQLEAMTQNMGLQDKVSFRKLKGNAKGYELNIPLSLVPLPAGLRPTIRYGNGYVAFSTDRAGAAAAINIQNKPLTGKLAQGLKGLPKDAVMLAVSDPSEYLPELMADIPFFVQAMAMATRSDPRSPLKGIRLNIDHDQIPSPEAIRKHLFPSSICMSVDDQGLTVMGRDAFPNVSSASSVPVLTALLLPAVQASRMAAKRSQSVNNLKQIMLAWHNYHAANNAFPPAAIADADGKPLLSWRVAILPYIDQEALYKEFHLDEPWDSPHNKTLIERMPMIYASTNVQPPQPFQTFYQTFVGPGAINENRKGKGTPLQEITDGTSNTLAVVEAGKPVPWTKPDDVPFDPEKMVGKLGGPGFPGGFNAGFCDGSVRFIKMSIDADVLKALITRNGGEVINANDF